ncbi:MAG TPA: hypothetical protein VK867_01880 [Candidatus Limnocylindrales bacterium]|nr:hypothetical protein [Candidatus Limnocylindrales bacterium]
MTSPRRLEQDLPALLGDLYLTGTPVYRDDLVQLVARTSQRPAWIFPGRWFPMEVVTTRVPATRLPMRQLGVLALIAILLATALAVYVGSQQPKLPPAFGVARNGLIAYDSGGDIYVVDVKTGETTAVIATPDNDLEPRFSRDGTRLVFRRAADGRSRLFVTDMSAAASVEITTEPVSLTPSLGGEPWEQYQFSPDGRSVVIASLDGANPGISIANADGTGIRRLNVGVPAHEPSFRPPDGREIVFVGVGDGSSGIYAVDVSTGAVRTVVQPSDGYSVAGATWAPDGSHIAYWRWGGSSARINAQTHVIAADGSGDRELPRPAAAVWNAGSEWSNGGRYLAIVRGYTDSFQDVRLAVAPVDGSSPGREILVPGTLNAECCATFEWSPDDSSLLVTPAGPGGEPQPQVIIDVGDGTTRPAPWGSTSDPTWQRLAE